MTAANKIRLIITQLQISSRVPKSLPELAKLKQMDGPEVLTRIRNRIAHLKSGGNHKLDKFSPEQIEEGLELLLKYIELSLLNILDYQGKFYDRTNGANTQFDNEFFVPWANSINP